MSALENIDPNPDNFVSAGILNTKMALVGCLLRLEPNKEKKVSICLCPAVEGQVVWFGVTCIYPSVEIVLFSCTH